MDGRLYSIKIIVSNKLVRVERSGSENVATIDRDDEEDEIRRRITIGSADNLGFSINNDSRAHIVARRDESEVYGGVWRIREERKSDGVSD